MFLALSAALICTFSQRKKGVFITSTYRSQLDVKWREKSASSHARGLRQCHRKLNFTRAIPNREV